MKKMLKSFNLFLCIICLGQVTVSGQVKSDSSRVLKNTIRINITNPMLFGDKYNVIGYERVFKNNQSISLGAGRFSFPKIVNINTDSLSVNENSTEKGFTVVTEYRFYLKKENKYSAPRGVYLGPYYSFNYFERNNSWDMNTVGMTGELQTKIKLNANLVGAQMGYQFVIKNRLSIDLVFMGPGVWFYSVKTKIGSTLSPEDQALVFDKINEFLTSKLPGNDITISPGETQKGGSYRTKSAGFRYVIHLGFRF